MKFSLGWLFSRQDLCNGFICKSHTVSCLIVGKKNSTCLLLVNKLTGFVKYPAYNKV